MTKLSIIIPKNADYSEVVDSIADALEAGIIIEKELKDGFQLTDLLAALQIQPNVSEIVNDIPVFLEQFVQLNGDTAKAAIVEARANVIARGREFGKVTNAIIKFLYVVANNYEFALDSYVKGQNQYLLWQTFLKGGDIFPQQ